MPILGSSASQSGKIPGVPTIGTATATSTTSATVEFTAPSYLGKGGAVTYVATSNPGSITGSSASSPITVSGLTAGSSYTFTVTAANAQVTSAASNASNFITALFLPVAAYYGGGVTSSSLGASPNTAAIGRIQFSNDALSTIGATLGTNSGNHGTVSNSGTAGYWMGGSSFGRTIRKLAYINESASTLSAQAPASVGVNFGYGVSNSGTAGYVIYNGITTVNKIIFSNDTATTLNGDWQNNNGLAALSNSGTAGYWSGQFTPPSSASTATNIRKLTFSNDSFSQISATIGTIRNDAMGMSNSGTAGYIMGGLISGRTVASIEKLTFSNETRTNVSATLNNHRYYGTAAGNKGVAGYQVAGASTTGGYDWVLRADLNKFNFSNDTNSGFGSITQNWGNAGMSNEGTI